VKSTRFVALETPAHAPECLTCALHVKDAGERREAYAWIEENILGAVHQFVGVLESEFNRRRDLARLRFIKSAQCLGLILDEIADLLQLEMGRIAPRLANRPNADWLMCARDSLTCTASRPRRLH